LASLGAAKPRICSAGRLSLIWSRGTWCCSCNSMSSGRRAAAAAGFAWLVESAATRVVRFAVRGVPVWLPAAAAYVSVSTLRQAPCSHTCVLGSGHAGAVDGPEPKQGSVTERRTPSITTNCLGRRATGPQGPGAGRWPAGAPVALLYAFLRCPVVLCHGQQKLVK
jgi:hypothetical protein